MIVDLSCRLQRNDFDGNKKAEMKEAALLRVGLWAETIKPPPLDAEHGGTGHHAGGGGDAAGGGGGCCEIM